MKEEGVLKILFWFSPALSAILIVLQIGENFVRFSDRPVLFYYSYCAKTPFPAEVVGDLAVFKLMMLCTVPVLIGEMCCHIAIFAKQWKIEARATVYVRNQEQSSRLETETPQKCGECHGPRRFVRGEHSGNDPLDQGVLLPIRF